MLNVLFQHSDRGLFVSIRILLGFLDFRQALGIVQFLLGRVCSRLLGGGFVLQLLDFQTECIAPFLSALFGRSLACLLVCLHFLSLFVPLQHVGYLLPEWVARCSDWQLSDVFVFFVFVELVQHFDFILVFFV